QIESAQARSGDADAAQKVAEKAKTLGEERGCPNEDDDMRIAALQGLMQMDAESALPILRQVLAKRGSCTEALRKHAVFIVSQKRSDDLAARGGAHRSERRRPRRSYPVARAGTLGPCRRRARFDRVERHR